MVNLARHTPLLRLTLIAFLFNALLPFFAVYQAPANGAKLSAVFGEKMLLCTGDGFKLVSWDDLANGKEKSNPHKKFQCALCYVAAHGTGVAAMAPEVADQPAEIVQLAAFYSKEDSLPPERLWQSRHTRSPPSSLLS